MLPLLIGDVSSPDICCWNSSVRLKLSVKTQFGQVKRAWRSPWFNSMGSQGSWGAVPGLYFHSQWRKDWKDDNPTETVPVLWTPLCPKFLFFENFSWTFSSIFLLGKIQWDGELRYLFLLWEGVRGYRAKSTSLVTIFSGPDPREQVDSEPKKRFFAALSVSQALADVSNMCETTSPSARAAISNDAPPRGPSSTKHDRHHLWVWLPSVTDSLRKKKNKKKNQHCHHCGPLLFRGVEEPSDLPQPFHSLAGVSFSSLFPV